MYSINKKNLKISAKKFGNVKYFLYLCIVERKATKKVSKKVSNIMSLTQGQIESKNFTLWKTEGEEKSLIANQVYIAKGTRTFGTSTRTNLIVLTHLPSVDEVYISNTFTNPLFNREYFAVGKAATETELDGLLEKIDYTLEVLEDLTLETLTKYGEGTKA